MRIFDKLRYPWLNLCAIFTPPRFKNIWKIFRELLRGQARSYWWTDRQTEQAGAGNYNTPPPLGSRVNNSVTHVIHNMLDVSGLATDSLNGVWGRGEQLASYMMVHF